MSHFAKMQLHSQGFFYLIFTLDKAEQQRKGMELKEDGEEKDIKHIGKMF